MMKKSILIKDRIRHIKQAVSSMESSTKHPRTSAHYKGILSSCNEILKLIG